MQYSSSTGGFYNSKYHAEIPSDAVEISDVLYKQLLDGQSEGKRIFNKPDGTPMLAIPPERGDLYTTEDGETWTINIDLAKAELMKEVQAEKKRIKDGGFIVNGTLFDSDDTANIAYLQFNSKLNANPEYEANWKASSGVWVTMNASLFAEVVSAIEAHYYACFAWQAAKEQEIANCNTAEDIEAFSASYS